MTRNIHKVELFRTDEMNGRSFEESVMLLADVGSVLDRFPRDLVDVRLGADDSNVVGMRFEFVESDMLSDQYPDSYFRRQRTLRNWSERTDRFVTCRSGRGRFELNARHDRRCLSF